MGTTARLSNIDNATSKEELTDFIQSKGLFLAPGQRISLTASPDGNKIAIISFADKANFKRALSLPEDERTINGRCVNIDDDFDGFTVLSEGTEVDIVALHGLNGHPIDTWEYRGKKGSFMWLRDSLSEQIPGARVMVYGYNANVLLDVSTGRIRTFAQTFLEGLRHQRDSESAEAQERPLILLAHSMGGLIVKQALLIANARADKRFDSILNSAGAVMFLGTPHQGGNGVDMGTFVANFVRAFGVKARSDIIRSLDPRSMVLFDLTDDFRQLVDAKGIEISTLFEIKKTHIGPLKSIWIVEEQSAVLGVTRERKVAINADHAHLCKFKSSTDRSLVTAVQVMKEFCKDVVPIITTRSASTQPPPPDELKYTCLADPDKLDDTPEYPVLILGQITYWALSHLDNRYGMTILAYNSNGSIVGRWSKTGARYVHHIEYHKGMREVAFIGQGNLSVIFKLAELKVSGHTSRFG